MYMVSRVRADDGVWIYLEACGMCGMLKLNREKLHEADWQNSLAYPTIRYIRLPSCALSHILTTTSTITQYTSVIIITITTLALALWLWKMSRPTCVDGIDD